MTLRKAPTPASRNTGATASWICAVIVVTATLYMRNN